MGDQRGASGAPVASEEVNACGECAAEPRRVPPQRAQPEPWVGVLGRRGRARKLPARGGRPCPSVSAGPERKSPAEPGHVRPKRSMGGAGSIRRACLARRANEGRVAAV